MNITNTYLRFVAAPIKAFAVTPEHSDVYETVENVVLRGAPIDPNGYTMESDGLFYTLEDGVFTLFTVWGAAIDGNGTTCALFTSEKERDTYILETLVDEPSAALREALATKGLNCEEVQTALDEASSSGLTTYATEELTSAIEGRETLDVVAETETERITGGSCASPSDCASVGNTEEKRPSAFDAIANAMRYATDEDWQKIRDAFDKQNVVNEPTDYHSKLAGEFGESFVKQVLPERFFTKPTGTARSAYAPDCVCWHDEGTGPLQGGDCRKWRPKPTTPEGEGKL